MTKNISRNLNMIVRLFASMYTSIPQKDCLSPKIFGESMTLSKTVF